MVFELSKSRKQILKAANDFAKGEFDKDLCWELDKSHTFPEKIWRKAGELGFIGMHYPEEYSGQSLGMLDYLLVVETLCRKDSTLGGALALSGFSAECLLNYGSQRIKEEFLPRVAEADLLSGGMLMSSESAAPELVAEPTTDGWRINGDARRIINGGMAGCYCLLCKTDPAAVAEKSMSMFIVLSDQEGLSIDPPLETLGLRMTNAATLRLENVLVPDFHLLGKPGAGLHQLKFCLNVSRLLVAAMALGTAAGAQDRALAYVKQRKQFGRKIASFQVTGHKLADMATKIEQARYLLYQSAAAFDLGRTDPKLIAMAKVSSCLAAVAVSSEAVQLMGGYGYTSEYEVERYYRDAKTLDLYPESSLVIKNDIARAVVGRMRK